MNIAHFFTFLRIILIPFFPLIYLKYSWFGISFANMPYFLLSILIICEFTDLIDGFIARKRNIVSDLGKVLDPMADSITHILIFFTFTQGEVSVPLLIVFVFLYREFFISTLRTICALKGIALAARKSGKAKTLIQACASFLIIILLLLYSHDRISLYLLQTISTAIISFAAIYTVISAVDYIYANRKKFTVNRA